MEKYKIIIKLSQNLLHKNIVLILFFIYCGARVKELITINLKMQLGA